jgi:hypothetical protein
VKEYKILSIARGHTLASVYVDTAAKAAADYYKVDPDRVIRIGENILGTGEIFARVHGPKNNPTFVNYINVEEKQKRR